MTVDPRQQPVEDDGVEPCLGEGRQGAFAAVDHFANMAEPRQAVGEIGGDVGIVLDDQYLQDRPPRL
ncbi:MAG TPA: hypothetical protein VF485_08470 [Sphingomonas sp.]